VKKPDLSIVIPIFNEQESIVECLTRIEKELHSLDYEIICVDDGSTDNIATNQRKI
jgi:glycosyltransferase involved in cell wall biosynthesis